MRGAKASWNGMGYGRVEMGWHTEIFTKKWLQYELFSNPLTWVRIFLKITAIAFIWKICTVKLNIESNKR